MEKVFSASLSGGVSSDVYFSISFSELKDRILSYGCNAIYIFDENTRPLLDLDSDRCLTIDSGEENKNYQSIDKILRFAISRGCARDSIFVAIGGGVICDMTAFASSIYMRGARVVFVPTTLLSMVDASVGGKTGIDYLGYKNLIGSFYPAEDILITLECLKSLDDEQYISGLGEVVKHAFLSSNDELFDFLVKEKDSILSRDLIALERMVRLSLEVKKEYIEADPNETGGIRSFLNLGHTFSHAFETCTNYSISHGKGVAWGVKRAFDVSLDLGLCSKDYYGKAVSLLSIYPFDIDFKIDESMLESYMEAIQKDKKRKDGSVKFVLVKGQGELILSPLTKNEILSVVI